MGRARNRSARFTSGTRGTFAFSGVRFGRSGGGAGGAGGSGG